MILFIRDYNKIKKNPIYKKFNNKKYLLSKKIERIKKNLKKPKKILIIKNDFIGDLVLSIPFINNLENKYPNSQIDIIIRSFSEEIIKKNNNISNIIKLDTPWLSRRDSISYSKLLIFIFKNFRKYDIVYELTIDPRNILLGFFLSKFRIGFINRGFGFLLNKKYNRNLENHIVEENLRLLDIDSKSNLLNSNIDYLVDNNYFKNLNLKKKYIVIHPGVSAQARNWGLDNFIELAKVLSKDNLIIVVENNNNILSKFKSINKNIISIKTNSISELVTIIKNSKLLIGLESLSIHLGATLDKNVIDIHSGTTPFWIMGPYCKNKLILFNNVDCIFCGKTACDNNICMKNITINDVIKAVKIMMKK